MWVESGAARHGDVAQMVERMLSMHEAQGSIACFSSFDLIEAEY